MTHPQNRKTAFSGIQSTGNIHLGNYLGAIKNWLGIQDSFTCLFGIMNLHAITIPQDPKELTNNTFEVAANYLACGLDPNKSKLFVQSRVSEHSELAWVLASITPMGWLNRMTQFKEKAKIKNEDDVLSNEENAGLGLYSYPVLMAADILLYHSNVVPVGEDQKQHIELTRDIAMRFNHLFKTEYFTMPQPLIMKDVKRIMSLQDGTKKMSKSSDSDLSRINLSDTPEEVTKKIKKAKTDSFSTISYDANRPEIFNLINIFAAVSGKDQLQIAREYADNGYGKFKNDLIENIISHLAPIQKNLAWLKQDHSYVKKVLSDGEEYARSIAIKTKQEVFSIIGLQ